MCVNPFVCLPSRSSITAFLSPPPPPPPFAMPPRTPFVWKSRQRAHSVGEKSRLNGLISLVIDHHHRYLVDIIPASYTHGITRSARTYNRSRSEIAVITAEGVVYLPTHTIYIYIYFGPGDGCGRPKLWDQKKNRQNKNGGKKIIIFCSPADVPSRGEKKNVTFAYTYRLSSARGVCSSCNETRLRFTESMRMRRWRRRRSKR